MTEPEPEPQPIGVVVADPHRLARGGLARIAEAAGLDVLDQAEDASGLARAVARCAPGVVLVTFEALGDDPSREIRRHCARPGAPPLVAMGDGADAAPAGAAALRAGATGYVLRSSPPEQVALALGEAAAGRTFVAPEVAGALVRGGDGAAAGPRLSEREAQVLRLLVAGRDNGEIAAELFLSVSTVKAHVASLLDKLGVENRVQAAVAAVRSGLV